MGKFRKFKKGLYLGVATLFLALQLPLVLIAPQKVLADGEGSSTECLGTTANVEGSIGGTDNGGSEDLATFDAGAGNIVEGVCIKSGENMFEGNKHSAVLGNGTYENGCYTVTGVGTQSVTVTRIGSGPNCQGISHIDAIISEVPEEEPAYPTATASIVACTLNSGLTDEVSVNVVNTNDETDETVEYTVELGGQTKTITLADGANGSVLFSGLTVGSYSAAVSGDDGTTATSNTVTVTLCEEENIPETGSIAIVKDAVPNDAQDFSFTTTGNGTSDFTLDDDSDATLSNTKVFSDLEAGGYSFTESENDTWELDSISCSEGASVIIEDRTVTVTLAEGQDVSCTFVNKPGKVMLCHATGSETNPYVKITVSAAGAFHGHLDDNFGGIHGDHQNGEDIIPPFTYKNNAYSQNWDAEGQAIFRNDCEVPEEEPETGSITVVKDARPDDAQDFRFTLSRHDDEECSNIVVFQFQDSNICEATHAGSESMSESFHLDDDDDGTLANAKTFSGLKAGTYTIVEDETLGWTLADIHCDTEFAVNGRTASVTLAEGEDITCTFTNDRQAGGRGGGQVLGVSTTANVAPAELVNTGQPDTMRNAYFGLSLLLAGIVNLAVSRKRHANKLV